MTTDRASSLTYHYPRSTGWSALGLGIFILLLCIWILSMVGLPQGGRRFADLLILSAAAFGLLMGAWGLWIIRSNPVVLQLDDTGLRGRNLPPLLWEDIDAAAVYGAGRYTKLGLKLRDPSAYRRRLSLREKHTRLNLSFKYDHVVYLGILTAPAHEINQNLQAFLARKPG